MLVMGEQRIILDNLYDVIRLNSEQCDVVRLGKPEQLHLAAVLREKDYRAYDRVVIFSRLKRLRCQLDVLRCIPGLVFLEHDACQNYMPCSKYRGLYSAFYRRLPWARVLASGAGVARRLRDEGADALFVPKGYDERLLANQGVARDIEAAFLGSLKGSAYQERRRMLEAIAAQSGLLITRTESGEEYLGLLNRIRIFISADVGMGEYMIKNFEAMACGCVLLAWSQGEEEDSALGFEDGKNVMLYRSAEEAVEKINRLKANPELAERIAYAGQTFVEQNYTFARVGRDLARAIEQPMRPWPGVSALQRMWVRLRYGLKV
jgi:glycosyltransferase involved in cell wall biosynthesis